MFEDLKVSLVNLKGSERTADCVSLTPELLAATAARYSRTNDGLEGILSRIDPDDEQKSVESIFKFTDYGHSSIAGLTSAIPIFFDNVSILSAFKLFNLCPQSDGQETSTRYVTFDANGVLSAEELGLAESDKPTYDQFIKDSFENYHKVFNEWERTLDEHPELLKISTHILSSENDRDQKMVARLKRNFAFDRSRDFLPASCKTNVVLMQSGRCWADLARKLLSNPYSLELQRIGQEIQSVLQKVTPNLSRHATTMDSFTDYWEYEFNRLTVIPNILLQYPTMNGRKNGYVSYLLPEDKTNAFIDEMVADLKFHDNRYDPVGSSIQRIAVNFGWERLCLAEIRDFNRHRTGTRYCPLRPLGFSSYCDYEPMQEFVMDIVGGVFEHYYQLSIAMLVHGDSAYEAFLSLGTEFSYQHTTTLDKLIYQIELRTGLGSHPSYAASMREIAEELFEKFPALRDCIKVGQAEPELM